MRDAGVLFHPLISTWFERRFGDATPVQKQAWPAIAAGRDALIAAPTGSGKTLAAFLFCLDKLVREADKGTLSDRTEILYVSPLKALSNDVHRNLEQPVAELGQLASELARPAPAIRTAVRTGDTTAIDRQKHIRTPPHVLVTTPESLFILLTAESGRRMLSHVKTIILDEIHAIASDKRGAHLALSIERLEDLVRRAGGERPQRIGLSATVRPIEVAARLLSGAGRPLPQVVDVGQKRDIDLAVEVPKDELGAVCTNEQWTELYDRIADLSLQHRSTLVFVNTRRLVERVAHHLGERLGEAHVAAHHGSLSRARRFEAERRLKAGDLRVVVATASLELGIDVGAIDLACLVGSPRSISTALQRIGRSGHAVGALPKGRLFPLTRDQLLECAAIVYGARKGLLDPIALRDAPLDVLAQQIVAMCACEDRGEDELFEVLRGAAPYAGLERSDYEAVVSMLSDGIATHRGRAGALLHRDAVGGRLRGRRGARLAALTSGGAIPDNANYDVILEPDGTKVGTIDEDFAVESMAGDVFLLGNTSWRIRRVEMGKVRVEDARGAAPSIPFWLGEAPARTSVLSAEVAALRETIVENMTADAGGGAARWLMEHCGLDQRGAELARDYVAAGKAALGAVPSQHTVVIERFFDEAGGMQLVVHAPFGGRINRAWGMALRKRFCRTFDFELQAAATDDGVLLSLSPQHSFPLETIFEMLDPDGIREVLVQAALQAPMFGTRWRWNASRSLALLRFQGGRRVPPAILRMRSDDLLSAVFPAQQACQDNHPLMAPTELPDHPLVSETVRDCLTEVMDAEGLENVLQRLARGEIKRVVRETPEPSVFSHEILNANPYAFLDDAPLEERRARAVTMRRGLPAEVVEHLGALDPEAIAAVREEVAPDIRNPDELHDLLLDQLAFPEVEGAAAGWAPLFEELVKAARALRAIDAARASGDGARVLWVPREKMSATMAAWPERVLEPALAALPVRLASSQDAAEAPTREDALVAIVRSRLGITGPITADLVARTFGVAVSDIDLALARVELEGAVLRGRFSPDLAEGVTEWCDRRLLARIHRRTLHRLRREIEPVTAAELIRFLMAWQHVQPQSRLHGKDGLGRVIEQLQGFELAAGAWESQVFAARVAGYDARWLDELCLTGEVSWGRLSPREAAGGAPSRAAPITLALRRDLPWLLGDGAPNAVTDEGLSHAARDVLTFLRAAGASFLDEINAGSRRLPAEVEDALWELVAAGRITGDSFAGLRALLVPASKRSRGPRLRMRRWQKHAPPLVTAGRWSLLRAPFRAGLSAASEGGGESRSGATGTGADHPDIERWAQQYLRRYGIVFRDLLAREAHAPAWRDLLRVYRRLEMRGEIRGGRLVAGFVGEQFATHEALEALRAVRKESPSGTTVRLSACDPLNLVGIITPGPRVSAFLGNHVTYRDGVPVDVEDSKLGSGAA